MGMEPIPEGKFNVGDTNPTDETVAAMEEALKAWKGRP